MTVLWIAFAIGALVVLGYAVHRLLLAAEDRGWIYYKTKGKGGAPSIAFLELAAIWKPDIEHVIEQEYEGRAVREDQEQGGPPLDD